MDTTVMEYQEKSSYNTVLQQEYEDAVNKGFNGTIEEYISFKDYT